MRFILTCVLGGILVAGGHVGCSGGDHGARPISAGGRLDLGNATNTSLAAFEQDSRAGRFFETAYAWAVFPKITKGALGVGVASGRGQVYRDGKLAGYAKLTSVTVGAQIGGQTFSEVIFFKNQVSFDKFTAGQVVVSASAGAVSGKQGNQDLANYSNGVVTFTLNNEGLIVAADVGGQQFDYQPIH